MSTDDCFSKRIADLQKQLANLDRERADVLAKLERMKEHAAAELQRKTAEPAGEISAPATLPNSDKIALFRSLFRGREDVFPRRWKNSKTGKFG